MSDWSWFTGEPKGLCPECSRPLYRTQILVEWRASVMHVECVLDATTRLAAHPPTPGASLLDGWVSP